jgi:hypothetical protein
MTNYSVIYGNYFPREVDSVWTTRKAAQDRAEELGGMWEVEETNWPPIAPMEDDK